MSDDFEFGKRLDGLIQRVEAWSYADSDAGAGVPVEIAAELEQLTAHTLAPTLRQALARAQDALDDGLPAETVAAELYRIRDALSGRS